MTNSVRHRSGMGKYQLLRVFDPIRTNLRHYVLIVKLGDTIEFVTLADEKGAA